MVDHCLLCSLRRTQPNCGSSAARLQQERTTITVSAFVVFSLFSALIGFGAGDDCHAFRACCFQPSNRFWNNDNNKAPALTDGARSVLRLGCMLECPQAILLYRPAFDPTHIQTNILLIILQLCFVSFSPSRRFRVNTLSPILTCSKLSCALYCITWCESRDTPGSMSRRCPRRWPRLQAAAMPSVNRRRRRRL